MTVNKKLDRKYAVLFRVHFWDRYTERQYKRLCSVVRKGDVFILVSETDVQVPHPNVIYHTQKTALSLGLNGVAEYGPFFWYNADYPLYIFYERHGSYDYYVMVEYDAIAQRSLDDIVDHLKREGIDFVGQTEDAAAGNWFHLPTCLDAYSKDQIQAGLISIAMFSNRAIRHIFARRVAMSAQYKAGSLRRWPYCEAFIATELAIAGFKMANLIEFGPADHYSNKPAVLEKNLPALAQQGFIHPVVNLRHYVTHAWRNLPKNPWNARKLRRALSGGYILRLAQRLWALVKTRS